MKPSWPQFPRPTKLGDGRSWTAAFESFDQRNDDVYYYILVSEEGRDPNGFFVRLTVPPEGEESAGPALRGFLREELNRLADEGRTNTDYKGSLVGWQAAEWLKARRKQGRTPEPVPAAAEAEAPAPRGRLFTSANGRLSFEMADEPSEAVFPLLSFLEQRFGLDSGFPIFGLDGVYAEGTAVGTKIVVGYDNWSGCFIQAFDEAGDRLVQAMGEALNGREDQKTGKPLPAGAGTAHPQPENPVRTDLPGPDGPIIPKPAPASRLVSAARSESEFDRLIAEFRAGAKTLDSSNSCRLPNQESGYDPTPLEAGLQDLILAGILPALKKHPAWLESGRLTALLEAVADARPAVQAYRARTLEAAGDYGNVFSPLAGPVARLVEAIAAALARKGDRDAVLALVPTEVLDARVELFREARDGRLDSALRSLREHLGRGG